MFLLTPTPQDDRDGLEHYRRLHQFLLLLHQPIVGGLRAFFFFRELRFPTAFSAYSIAPQYDLRTIFVSFCNYDLLDLTPRTRPYLILL